MSTTGSEVEDLPLDTDYDEEAKLANQSSVYFSQDFISKPTLSEKSSLPAHILQFDYSFGYDCKRYYNLIVADEKILIFVSGNLINFFNVETKEFQFRRSAFGRGIGHITKNPNSQHSHIAVGENGTKPPIIIYEWPSLKIVCLLQDVAAKCFTHLTYSPDGMWLASQSGEPDFLITVYNWEKQEIIVQTKSYEEDVYRVMFSPTDPGHLTSCGKSHIKFWKMVKTFSGLKFQGQEGRFGTTGFSNVLGVYLMPDQKVVSGCEWGNILLWENGLIKVEVSRRLNRKCHEAPITQFFYANGDLWSIGMDGRIKLWYYKHLDLADPPDEDRFLRIEPSYQFNIPEVMFMNVIKENDDPESTCYFAQDGNGGIWRIDLNIEADPKPPVQLYKCHAGAVVDIAACPWGPYLASLGIDGRLQLYQYVHQKLLFVHQYPAKGTSMIWVPLNVQPSGDQLIMGFDDGNLRVVILNIPDDLADINVTTIQVTKPHNRAITKTTINKTGTVLVTGSEDSSIFIYQVKSEPNTYSVLIPVGYITVPGTVTCLTWHHKLEIAILIGCIDGHFLQVEVPTEPQTYTTVTYVLQLQRQQQRFTSCKDQMQQHNMEAMTHRPKSDKKLVLADFDSKEELLKVPEVPNSILWMQTTDESTIWISVGGNDAGYIYEYYIDQTTETPSRFQIIQDANDMEISSCVYNYNKEYLILALQDGSIRVVKTNSDDWRDLSDYWQLSMHDNYNGFIPRMCFSFDEKYFFSCGHDGNIFSYKFNPMENKCQELPVIKQPVYGTAIAVADLNGYANLSLEETKVKMENDRIQKEVNQHRCILLVKLEVLRDRFQKVLKRNSELKTSQTILRNQFEIDSRITAHLNAGFHADLELIQRKLAFDVEKSRIGMEKLKIHLTDPVDLFPIRVDGIQTTVYITNERQRKLSDTFYDMMDDVGKKVRQFQLKVKWEKGIKIPERPPPVKETPAQAKKKEKQLEHFLNGLSPTTIQFKLGPKLTQLLHKYRIRKLKAIKRQDEWNTINMFKPSKGLNQSKNEATLAHAVETIGDYKLKSAADYRVPKHLWKSTVIKYKELLDVRLKQYNIRHNFNLKVCDLREKKVQLRKYLVELNTELEKVHQNLDEEHRKNRPPIPEITDNDFLEKNLEVVCLPKSQNEKQMKNENQLVIEPPKADLLEQEVLTTMIQKGNKNGDHDFPLFIECDNDDYENIDILSQCHDFDTPWEVEARNYHQSRKLFEQELILKKMQKAIKTFDTEVEQLAREKLQVTRDADFLDLHLLTLYQELYILKDLESEEDQLQDKVYDQMQKLLNVGKAIEEIKHKIKEHKIKVNQLQEQEKNIQGQFATAVASNKFCNFLRTIFKKKHKPSNELTSSTETLTSAEEQEQNNTQVAGVKDTDIKMDESVCPKDCDRTLYDMTFDLRSKRDGITLKITELNANIELLMKELDGSFNKVEVIINDLKRREEELDSFQAEKQKKLNQIMCVVVLQLHQLQHLDSQRRVNKIGDTLVFSKTTLSKLYKRVGQLHNETLLQKIKHKINMTHLCRIKTDCRYMEKTLEKLKAEIVEKMKIKFGRVVNLDEIEEAQLRKMVFDLRMSQTDIKGLYEHELNVWKDKYESKQIELKQAIEQNTARIRLITTINREKAELVRLLARQTRKKEHLENVFEITNVFKKDIEKLSEIVKNQNKELQILREDIKRLSLKGLPTPKDHAKEKIKPEEEEEEPEELFQWKDWSYDILRDRSAALPVKAKIKAPEDDEEEEEEEEDEEEEEEGERESRTFTTEVQIPPVLPDEAEDIAKTSILEMLTSLGSYQGFSAATLESLVEQILHDVLGRSDVAEVTECLMAFLPEDATDVQKSIIGRTADQIFSLQESEIAHEDVWQSAREILVEIIDETLLTEGTPQDLITRLLEELVEQLPFDFLLKHDSINTIVDRIKDQLPVNEANKEELIQTVLSITSDKSDEIRMILEKVLERVFGTGIDYLYYVKP